ncbi:MAG: phage holin family protein [Clostridiales bacterium]|nr:phage holin family protein [Clostridiales bacterium]
MEILNTFVNPVIVCFCLVVGYAIKHLLPKVSNRIIPTVVVIVGIVVALWINQWAVITPDIILSGALSGLASTGLHQLFKQWIDSGGKVEQ